jgi:hypothetical protein
MYLAYPHFFPSSNWATTLLLTALVSSIGLLF